MRAEISPALGALPETVMSPRPFAPRVAAFLRRD
jgi:hypothetical protein